MARMRSEPATLEPSWAKIARLLRTFWKVIFVGKAGLPASPYRDCGPTPLVELTKLAAFGIAEAEG
jgi:hypothetical protein